MYAVAGLMQPVQSQPSSVESASATDKPDSSELYDPLEGTESDGDDDDDESSAMTSSAVHSAAPPPFSADASPVQSLTQTFSFSPASAVAQRSRFSTPYPGMPQPGLAAAPTLRGRPPIPVPGMANFTPPGRLPSRIPVRPMSRLPPHMPPPPGAQFPRPPMTHLPPVSTTVTAVTTHSDDTSKPSSTVASLKTELSKRRFTEEKEEDRLPENLLGYQVTCVNLLTVDDIRHSDHSAFSPPGDSEVSISGLYVMITVFAIGRHSDKRFKEAWSLETSEQLIGCCCNQ